MIDALNHAAFSIGGTPTSWAEILGFITGALSVYLVAKANIWTWPVGIANALFFFILFIDAKLYSDAWLQLFYVGANIFGWWAWLKAGPNRTKLKINNTPSWAIPITAVGIIVAVWLLVPVLRNAHGAYPIPDSTSTSLSVAAQIFMGFKLIENWYLWIAADIIYIPLYFVKKLYFTSFLYVVFMALCFMGLAYWKKVQKARVPVRVDLTKDDGTGLPPTTSGVREPRNPPPIPPAVEAAEELDIYDLT